jgi:hypothetical protein
MGAAVVLSLSLACGGGPGNGATFEVRDSAGIEVVTNLVPTAEAIREEGRAYNRAGQEGERDGRDRWRVADTPLAAIESQEDGEGYVLYRVSHLVFMGSDRIVAGVGSTNEVLVLTVEGDLLASMGGRGEGPGQFRYLASVSVLPGDSVVVFDSSTRQAWIFDASGTPVRSFLPEPERDPFAFEELLATGSGPFVLLRRAQVQPGVEAGTHRISAPSFLLGPEGRQLAELGPFQGRMMISGTFFGSLLFSPELVAAALGDEVVIGVGDDEELRMFGPEGRLSRIVRWPGKDRTLEPELVEEIVTRANELSPEPAPQPIVDQLLQLPFPEEYPPYGRLLVSDREEVWVGDYWVGDLILPEAPVPPLEWTVFDSSGVWLASVTTPAGFKLHAVRGHRLLGIYRDELGVESIRIYSLERGGSP